MDTKIMGFLTPHPPVIIPAIGNGREEGASKTIHAMNTLSEQIEKIKPDTIVLISPHAPMFSDYVYMYGGETIEGDLSQFGFHEKMSFKQDIELITEIERLMKKRGVPGGRVDDYTLKSMNISPRLDHGALVPLYFLTSKYKKSELVIMAPSGLGLEVLYKLGGLLKEASGNIQKKIVVIASGDMSHKVNEESPYGSALAGEAFDQFIANMILEAKIEKIFTVNHKMREEAAECGYRSLVILAGVYNEQKVESKLLSYEAPFGIGYCVASFVPTEEKAESALDQSNFSTLLRENESVCVRIARSTLETFVREGIKKRWETFKLKKEEAYLIEEQAGTFVSIKKFGELRGCIGTTGATQASVVLEIIENAIAAGTRDPRFPRVMADELPFLEYSVDILEKALPVQKREELDPKKYGVIVQKGSMRGLLLPDLEGVNTVDEQLHIACQKAGIDPYGTYDMYKFEVRRYR